MPVSTQSFKGWLKSANNMKLSSHASVVRLTHEGITNFASLSGFDKNIIQDLSRIYKNSIPVIDACTYNDIGAESAISGANTSSILVRRLITSVNASKNCGSIARVVIPHNMSYSINLANFKFEWEACLSTRDAAEPRVPKVPKTNHRCNDRNPIRWTSILKDCVASSCGWRRPLINVLCEDTVVPDEIMDPLLTTCYYG